MSPRRARGTLVLTVFALAALLCRPGLATEDDSPSCDAGAFEIEAPSRALAAQICADLLGARDMMLACGLVQTRPVSVEVVGDLAHPIDQCLSHFDCDFNVIRITDPRYFGQNLAPDDAYAQLPNDVLLAALLTHELAHALVVQSAGGRDVAIVDQEYIASALEMKHLDVAWRETLIRAAPVSQPPKPGLVDILIYGLAPRKFATNAWQHFDLEENGCRLVTDIVEGRFTFAR